MALEETIRGIPPSEKTPRKLARPRKPRGLIKKLLYTVGGLLVATGGAAVVPEENVPTQIQPIVEPVKQVVGDLLKRIDLGAGAKIRPEKGQSGAEYWFDLSAEQIKGMAKIPVRNFDIGDKYVSTVSPALQERAKKGGYHLVYQADPNDTTGYSVLPGPERDFYPTWAMFFGGWTGPTADIPFAGAGGIIKGYVPIPEDPEQKTGFYLLLHDPFAKQDFLLRVSTESQIIVTDLNKGLNTPNTDRSSWPSFSDPKGNTYMSPTIKNLINSRTASIEKLLNPNGVAFAFLRVEERYNPSTDSRVPTGNISDENGIRKGMDVFVPYFGGWPQLEQELKISNH